MGTNEKTHELSRIEKRGIEALAIAPFIKAVARKIGKEETLAILTDVNQEEAFQRGQRVAGCAERNGIEELVKDVETWGIGGLFQIEVLEQTESTYFFNVIRCPYYEKYLDLGVEEFGVAFSCCRDEPFAKGFNPGLQLVRTRTIMEGADHCDFRYYLNAE